MPEVVHTAFQWVIDIFGKWTILPIIAFLVWWNLANYLPIKPKPKDTDDD